ncbi:MAG: prepilin-type N-terminal cleavage/methylation domain-containing protein [Verrucomicrobia bacterium]|nr:MAG: prepilin-type N-terminal cleavage/methylation domain-containing protein [Verrucomicrobiota bacterium]
MKHCASVRRRGFTMVEVALAVLILGVGVLTVVGLMSGSLQMSKGGDDDAQIAGFANNILEGIRAETCVRTNGDLADSFRANLGVGVVASNLWDQTTRETKLKADGQWHTVTYAVSPTNIDATFRYRLTMDNIPAAPADRAAAVRLDVLMGKYGQMTTQSFSTEVFRWER